MMDLLPDGALQKMDRTRFLTACRNGDVTRSELEIFLVQQHHYSRHFTRFLCALMGNLQADEDRQALTENLFEEMGLGDLGEKPHSTIYREMLAALELNPANSPAHRETVHLVTTMHRLCSSPEPLHGLGALCLGAEAIVPHIYTQIMNGLRARGFPEEHLTFFPMHIDGDDDHALTMKAIIERELARNPDKRPLLQEAAREAMEARTAFFHAVSRAAREAGAVEEEVVNVV